MMEQAILNFHQQFAFQPKVENADQWNRKGGADRYLLLGMGGSHLAGDLLSITHPNLDLIIHSDYGLPENENQIKDRSVIASSYSGNTEEVLEGFEEARAKGIPIAVIAVGGKLLQLAKRDQLPYIQMPDTGIQPRSALGFSFRSLLALIGDRDALKRTSKLAEALDPTSFEDSGKRLAQELQGKIPVIYSSARNRGIAYNWKIKFNETGKIPAFENVLPELNHNEMNGFDGGEALSDLLSKFHFIFLIDQEDHPQVQKRFKVLKQLYSNRNLPVTEFGLRGSDSYEKIFSSLLIADWCALHSALLLGADPEPVPMVEEFKNLISKER